MKHFISHIFTRLAAMVLLLGSLPALTSCHDIETYDNDPYGTFDCLAKVVDEHYCFFAEKDVDWQEVSAEYRRRIIPDITQEELFRLCAEMLDELRDGHVNLSSPFNTSYYRQWWTDYPQDFNMRTLEQYYLDFDWMTTCGIMYKILPDNIGYLYYPSFGYTVGDGNLDYILALLSVCNGLVIDVRNNGGGNVTGVDTFVARFIHEPMTAGYIRHKTGPGHDDFSEPYPVVYKPAKENRMVWDKPIAVLCNRSTFSAANDFVSVMKQLPNATVIGSRTGGGGGMPYSYDLPNGWIVRLSASPITDAQGRSIEEGIEPDIEVHATDEQLAAGIDPILDRALTLLQ